MKVKDLLEVIDEDEYISILVGNTKKYTELLKNKLPIELTDEKILNWKIEKILADSSTLCICLNQNVSKEDREVAMKIIYSIKIFGEC